MPRPAHTICSVVPQHILRNVADHASDGGGEARSTLEHMREVALDRNRALLAEPAAVAPDWQLRRRVYDAGHAYRLPGRLVLSDDDLRSCGDVHANEAYDGSGATHDFFARAFGRDSVDGRGMRVDSSVHYGERFTNAFWNGRQMIYGDGDGRIFNRFTGSIDIIAHELTHGVTQFSAALGYTGQTGALNEHLSDAFGIMVKQYALGQLATESDWLIGAGLFSSAVSAKALRSMAAPGTAYDDPILGRDPQPGHMDDYVETPLDNGGVHVNSGIPNRAFCLAATQLGGYTWEVAGKIWYAVLTDRLTADATFADFARATVDIAGELYGNGGYVQRLLAGAWDAVGLSVPLHACEHTRLPKRRRKRRTVNRDAARPARSS